jgi:hypothetical protein
MGFFDFFRKKEKKLVGATDLYEFYAGERNKSWELTGSNKYKTFDKLVAEGGITGSSIRAFHNLMSGATISLEGGTARSREQIQFIFDNMPITTLQLIQKASLYYFYGFTLFEWCTYKLPNGSIGIGDIKKRENRTIDSWELDDQGNIVAVKQTTRKGNVRIDRDRLLYIAENRVTEQPQGLGVLQSVVKLHENLVLFQYLEAVGFKTDLRGIPIGYAPIAELMDKLKSEKLTAEEINQILEPLKSFIQNKHTDENTALVLDSSLYVNDDGKKTAEKKWSVELLQHNSQTQNEVANAIKRITHEIARTMGAKHLVLGDSDRGSFALAEAEINNFFTVGQTIVDDIERAIYRDLITPLGKINGIRNVPKLKIVINKPLNLINLSAVITALSKNGIQIDPESDDTMGTIFELMNIPLPKFLDPAKFDPNGDVNLPPPALPGAGQ